jgi:hypothetical protein
MAEDTVSSIYAGGGGDYLKAADLEHQDWELVITGYERKIMDQTDFETGEKYKKEKVILSFAGEKRTLVLNATNARAIAAAYGDTISNWIGKTIIVYEGDWQGKPALRVRTPKIVKKAVRSENPADGMPSDEIPF